MSVTTNNIGIIDKKLIFKISSYMRHKILLRFVKWLVIVEFFYQFDNQIILSYILFAWLTFHNAFNYLFIDTILS
jgi:hypothetical protein